MGSVANHPVVDKSTTQVKETPQDTGEPSFQELAKKEIPFAIGSIPFIWQVLFLYLPIFFLFASCFFDFTTGAFFPRMTFNHFSPLLNATYLFIIANSLTLASITTLGCLLIGLPLAYCIAFHFARFRNLLIFLLILPFWTNFILHVFAWGSLFENYGLFNTILLSIGVIQKPLHLLNTHFATYFMAIYYYLPFMVLPIYSSIERFDQSLFEASYDLGATKSQTIRRILLPLTLSSMRVGVFLVFIPAFGEFLIPEFMGGDREVYVGTAVSNLVLGQNTFGNGVALTAISIAILLPAVFLFDLMIQKASGLIARGFSR